MAGDRSVWHPPPSGWRLCASEVHVWRARLDFEVEGLAATFLDSERRPMLAWLSPDESDRAGRFRFPEHRRRFILARAGLRWLLGRYLDIAPEEVRFNYEAKGKPVLAAPHAAKLHFNLSHSEELAVYAFSCDAPVGIDVEYLRALPEAMRLADRFFSAPEARAIASLTPEKQGVAFLRAWTRKEAYLKATGEGISASLAAIEVTLLEEEACRILRLGGDDRAAARWQLWELVPDADSLAAVAIRARASRLLGFDLDLAAIAQYQ